MLRQAGALFRLLRPDASALLFLSVFLPLLTRSGDFKYSLENSFPLILVGVCVYLADHLDDIDIDRVNHPDRPLPSGQISPQSVVIFHFLILAAALISTRILVRHNSFLYYLLLILGVNYRYVAAFLPGLKSAYVSVVTIIPILILIGHFPKVDSLRIVAVSVLLFTFSKELCMDFLDRHGDPTSFLREMSTYSLGVIAFALQGIGIIFLIFAAENGLEAAAVLAIGALAIVAGYFWFAARAGRKALVAMKTQLLVGIIFLL